ncbi:RNA-directed DNA polymerase, eukaryota, reverse transcriptase zinc-binding domain protein [Tanacetum coccineum]
MSYGRLVDAFIANKRSKGDSSTVLLLKLNEADTLSNIYAICKSEGFMDLSIHHVGGLWIWIQFSSSLSCSKFRENANMKSLYSSIRTPSPFFKVDERMIWIQISGLTLCAWGSNAYKKVASLFGKFKFFEDEESTAMSLGRVCISTRSHKQVSETIKVEVNGEIFDVNVHEIEDKLGDDLDDLNGMLNNLGQATKKEETPFKYPNDIKTNQPQKHVDDEVFKQPDEEFTKVSELSNLSRPPGFENTKRSSSNISICTTNFARHHKKDIKGLIDLPIGGRYFTWMNKAGTKLSKLDRFRISEGITEYIPDIKITAIDRMWSDHSPILLHVKKANFGPSPFKFYNTWLNKDGFDDLIKSTWDSMDTSNRNRNIRSHEKLRGLKTAIKKWQADVRKNDRSQKHGILSEIKDIEKKIDDGSTSTSDHEKRIKLLQDIDKLDNLEALDLIQKAHIKWDIEGDENSKFFHGMINNKRRSQAITSILHDGVWISEPPLIKEVFLNYYKEKFQAHDSHVVFPLMTPSYTRCPLDSEFLELQIFQSGLIRGIKLGSFDITLSHLFYADDVVITIDWNSHDIDNIIRVLHVFYLASGLRINIHKSNLYGIGVSNDEISPLASRTGCAASSFPYTYLGLPIGANMNLTSSWSVLIDRFQKRLSSWKANLLSIGGHLTFIKAVLVLPSFDKRGLNIGSLKAFNLALLQKWRWRMFSSPNTLWVNTIKALHGQDGGLDNKGCNFNGTWSRIVVNIFLWRLSLDRLPHRLNLLAHGIEIPTISCSSCNGNVESADHIFFACDLVKEV